MTTKIALIYATCQGSMLHNALQGSKEFTSEYTVVDAIHNYELIRNGRSFLTYSNCLENLKNADLFIYQPLGLEYGPNATDVILKHAKPSAKLITVPYVLNRSFWPVVPSASVDTSDDFEQLNFDVLKNKIAIYRLLHQGHTRQQIVDQYLQNQIDFEYDRRFSEDIARLEKKELTTTVKVSEFIKQNYQQYKLFDSPSHPAFITITHMANQILQSLNFEPMPLSLTANPDRCYAPTHLPVEHSAILNFKMNFDADSNGTDFYLNIINKLIDKYHE
jgi:hypothetical protein